MNKTELINQIAESADINKDPWGKPSRLRSPFVSLKRGIFRESKQ